MPRVSLCECGCGQQTDLAPRNNASKGWVKGEPLRFVRFHHLKQLVKPESQINYPTKLLPDGRVVKKHRLRAEQALGKPLPAGVEVHHVDGTKSTSSPLVICQDRDYHKLLHVRTRVLRAGGNPNTDKICARCKNVKPFAAFRVSRHTGSGFAETCRECVKQRYRESRLVRSA